MNLNFLIPAFVIYLTSISCSNGQMLGLFTQFKSAIRIFTSMQSFSTRTIQECCFHCISNHLCAGFNLESTTSSKYSCMLGFTLKNVTCGSLLKQQSSCYYDRESTFVSKYINVYQFCSIHKFTNDNTFNSAFSLRTSLKFYKCSVTIQQPTTAMDCIIGGRV